MTYRKVLDEKCNRSSPLDGITTIVNDLDLVHSERFHCCPLPSKLTVEELSKED